MTKQDITYQDKLDELKLDIKHPNSQGIVFILVEGDTDIRLFRKLFNLANCKIEYIPGGKNKVELCVEEILNDYNLVIGIRDADFIFLNNEVYERPNMFLTDLHDIEMTLISKDDIFSSVVLEYKNITNDEIIELRNKIMKTISNISLLKWLNQKEDLRIDFEKTGFQHLISFVTSEINFAQYFSNLLSKSPNARITDLETINTKLLELRNTNPDQYQLCNGHDYLKALSEYLRIHGNTNNINSEIISSIIRIKCSKTNFETTNLHHLTKTWAVENNVEIY